MRATLCELWYGNINPAAKSYKLGTEYARLMKQVCAAEERLTSLLDDTEKEALSGFAAAKEELAAIEEREAFIEGFRLGTRLASEAFDDDGCFESVCESEK